MRVHSGSVWGGVLSLAAFFYNHGQVNTVLTDIYLHLNLSPSQATRVMWTPPLRESFAMPFLLLQNLVLSHTLRCVTDVSRGPHCMAVASLCRRWTCSWSLWTALALSTLAFLLPWQFSQFALLTQVTAIIIIVTCESLPPSPSSLPSSPPSLSDLGSFSVTCAQSASHSLSHVPPHTVCHSCKCCPLVIV